MKYIVLHISFIMVVSVGLSQPYTISEITSLPEILQESSGLEINNDFSLWSHNDNGLPELYCFDTVGNVIRTITLNNASAIDWEDLTKDNLGYIYVGDFGNNYNNRENLKIFRIPNPSSFSEDDINTEIIHFSFPDQTQYPPPLSNLNFDIEAMIWHNDNLYLFTKNRSEPSNGYTKVYRLPSSPGVYIAELVDSLYTSTESSTGRITAADINTSPNQLALLSKRRIYYFDGFEGDNFFSGNTHTFTLPINTSKEGICFINNNELYITDEIENSYGGKLYKVDISNTVHIKEKAFYKKQNELELVYHPRLGTVTIFSPSLNSDATLLFCSVEGSKIKEIHMDKTVRKISLSTIGLPRGNYVISIFDHNNIYSKKIVIY